MRYCSTRGGSRGVPFSEVVLSSYASDGGLYVPESLPQIDRQRLRSWSGLSYLQLVQEILSLFVTPDDGLSRQEINTLLEGVYDDFDTPEVLPVVQVGPVYVAEPWHGPTGVFKDLVLPVLARLCNHFLEKRGQRATILVSTTGDTGGTTIRSARGMKNLRSIVAYPRYTVSRIQELQMTTTGAKNAVVFSHQGISDDIDLILRNIFQDKELLENHILLSFNSIHTVRVLLNITQYVFIYLRLAPNVDRRVLVSVPTGGMGNAAGGVMAAEMGLPLRILSAVNENDVVHRAFTSGDFSVSGPQIPTYAAALDSVLPHNIERVFFYALKGDTVVLKKVMEDYERSQKSVLPRNACDNFPHLLTASVNKEECLETMKMVWEKFGYPLCPHSAVAWKAVLKKQTEDKKTKEIKTTEDCSNSEIVVVMATATSAKFPEILEKINVPVPPAAWKKELEGKEEVKLLMDKGQDWEKMIRDTILSGNGFI